MVRVSGMFCTSLGKSHKPHLRVLQDSKKLLQSVIFDQLPVSTSFSITGMLPEFTAVKAGMCSSCHSNKHTLKTFWSVGSLSRRNLQVGYYWYFETFSQGIFAGGPASAETICWLRILSWLKAFQSIFSPPLGFKSWLIFCFHYSQLLSMKYPMYSECSAKC